MADGPVSGPGLSSDLIRFRSEDIGVSSESVPRPVCSVIMLLRGLSLCQCYITHMTLYCSAEPL